MQIVSINERQNQKHKEEMLEVINDLKTAIESDEIKEFVAASVDNDGEIQIHAVVMDIPGAVGLFEIGKHMLITTEV
jgi:peroxiredoxin